MDMAMEMPAMTTATATMQTTTASMIMETGAPTMSMSMGTDGCKLSMLLNWHTIDACFLSSAFRIRSSFAFFATCFGAFLLVLALESLRRGQREFDRYLRARDALAREKMHSVAEDAEDKKLLDRDGEGAGGGESRFKLQMKLEQIARGSIHMVQFGISYCIMLMFMYSNGYIIISILFGALVGFALFTGDTLYSRKEGDTEDRDKTCC